MANPQLSLTCEIGFAATPSSDITTVTWTNVSSYLRLQDGVYLNRGRQDETQQVGAGTATFSLDNRDGRFTPGNTAGAYYPNVKIRRPVRFRHATSSLPVWCGYIDSWDEGWNNGVQPIVRVRAADLMARIANRTMRALTIEEQLYDAPVLHYPLNDAVGSLTASNQSGNTYASLAVTQAGAGGTCVFGQAGGLGADTSEQVPVLTRSDASNGLYLTQTFNPLPEMAARTAVTLECFVYLPLAIAGTVRLLELARIASLDFLAIDLSTNFPATTVSLGASTITATSGVAINDGAWHHVAAFYDGAQLALIVDGNVMDVKAAVFGTATFSILTVGAKSNGTTLFNGWVSGVAVYNTALSVPRLAEHAATRNGCTGETSLARFNRICRLAVGSWTANTSSFSPSATMGKQPTKDQSASALLYGVADAEVAPDFISAAGFPSWQARAQRSPSAAPTSVAASLVSSDTGFSTSDQLVTNDVTYNRPGGATVNVTDAASITAYGRLDTSKSVYYDTDAQLRGAANYILNSHSTPQLRTGSLTIDLTTADATVPAATLLALDVGSVLRVTSLPRGSASLVDVFIEGVNDAITATSWRRTCNTSPLQVGGASWLMGSTTYSVLGSTTRLGF